MTDDVQVPLELLERVATLATLYEYRGGELRPVWDAAAHRVFVEDAARRIVAVFKGLEATTDQGTAD
jgi:hypothetical protein